MNILHVERQIKARLGEQIYRVEGQWVTGDEVLFKVELDGWDDEEYEFYFRDYETPERIIDTIRNDLNL